MLPPLGAEPAGDDETARGRDRAGQDGEERVAGAGEAVAVEEQGGGGLGEGAVGGEPAEDPGAEEQPQHPPAAGIGPTMRERFQQHTEGQRSGDVDPEDRPTHPAIGRKHDADDVTEGSTSGPADGDEADVPPPQMHRPHVVAGSETSTSGSEGSWSSGIGVSVRVVMFRLLPRPAPRRAVCYRIQERPTPRDEAPVGARWYCTGCPVGRFSRSSSGSVRSSMHAHNARSEFRARRRGRSALPAASAGAGPAARGGPLDDVREGLGASEGTVGQAARRGARPQFLPQVQRHRWRLCRYGTCGAACTPHHRACGGRRSSSSRSGRRSCVR